MMDATPFTVEIVGVIVTSPVFMLASAKVKLLVKLPVPACGTVMAIGEPLLVVIVVSRSEFPIVYDVTIWALMGTPGSDQTGACATPALGVDVRMYGMFCAVGPGSLAADGVEFS